MDIDPMAMVHLRAGLLGEEPDFADLMIAAMQRDEQLQRRDSGFGAGLNARQAQLRADFDAIEARRRQRNARLADQRAHAWAGYTETRQRFCGSYHDHRAAGSDPAGEPSLLVAALFGLDSPGFGIW